ncbi:hypothetical protein Pr1d_13400 [Bythopirellula goksoeyrii]|uniref:Uncharacterized protein n=1 Tax=Bythopirellula goksoeyrii TaxID=1400387 RepID=A0A5B9Q4V8_9BACT|nr:hypothetical protein Pr1d_13400 [Bythopirellula goksoeyrii]
MPPREMQKGDRIGWEPFLNTTPDFFGSILTFSYCSPRSISIFRISLGLGGVPFQLSIFKSASILLTLLRTHSFLSWLNPYAAIERALQSTIATNSWAPCGLIVSAIKSPFDVSQPTAFALTSSLGSEPGWEVAYVQTKLTTPQSAKMAFRRIRLATPTWALVLENQPFFPLSPPPTTTWHASCVK